MKKSENSKYNKKNIVINIIFIVTSFLFFIALYFTSIQFVIKNSSFFTKYYTKFNIEEETGISVGDATKIVMTLINYMDDKTDSLEISVKKYAYDIDSFNDQEITHMKDVKDTYQNFILFRNIVFVIYTLLLIYFVCKHKKNLLKNTMLSFLPLLLIVIICIILIPNNFSFFWDCFHHLLFNNNLWIFDYNTSIIVQVCTNNLFKTIIIYAFLFYVLLLLILSLIVYIVTKLPNHNFRKV